MTLRRRALRTPLEMDAFMLNASLKRAAEEAEKAGMEKAATMIAQAREEARKSMHPEDREYF